MKGFSFKSLAPHLLAITIFAAITLIYFSPLLEGKQLKQGDVVNFQGASKEIIDYRNATGDEALWTGRMFSGMPAFQISVVYSSLLVKYFDGLFTLWLPHPAGLVFLYFIGFYILLLVLKVDFRIAIIGAIAFALSSYFFIILEAGHNTKAHAIGYMAPVLAGVIMCFRGRYLLGGILTTLFLSLEIFANHVQISYYLLLIILVLAVAEFVAHLKEKELKKFVKAAMIMFAAVVIAIGTNITNLWSTYEYGKYSTRGKSELTTDAAVKTSGLDRDYATDWSYGKWETFTLLIPDFMGGASQGEFSKNSDTYKALKENGIQGAEKIVKQMPTYWGPQPFTSGPVYAGAIICFLFILGLFIVKGKYKYWLLSATILSIMLAWGRHMMWFTNIFFDFVPGYNKFRAVSMTLVIAELCIPLLGLLALKNMFSNEISKEAKLKALKMAGLITGAIIVVFGFLSGMFFDFTSDSDAQLVSAGYPDWLVSAIQSDRHGLLLADSFRSFAFIALTAGTLWLLALNKLKNQMIAALIIGILVLGDMMTIDKRYLNATNFTTKAKVKTPYTPTTADLMILQDKDPEYRVYNLTVSPFNDASTSYFHNSIGGYHGAKLKRYQELIEMQISKQNMKVLNMLNTRYFIVPDSAGNDVVRKNPDALGPAWFVKEYKLVVNADSEIAALTHFDPSATAIVDKRFESSVKDFKYNADSTATIKLNSYKPNDLIYKSSSKTPQLTVFSEIYYDKGWNAYVDGKLTPYFRTNYVLRGMIIPAGDHTIEWKFEPSVYYTGEKIGYVFNILLIVIVIGGLGLVAYRQFHKKETAKA